MRLAWHFHNGNDPFDFAMYLIMNDTTAGVKRSRNVTYPEALKSTWKSMTQVVERPFAAVVYPNQGYPESTWFCIDVDAHSDDPVRARHAWWLVQKLRSGVDKFLSAPNRLAVLIEKSGRGYHLFFVSPAPTPIRAWTDLRKRLVKQAGLERNEPGLEFFPADSGKRLGVRLPGSANPKTWHPASGDYKVSKFIAASGLKDLLANLPTSTAMEESFNKRRSSPLLLKPVAGTKMDKVPAREDSPAPWQTHKDAIRILARHAINGPSSRRKRLASLVGDGIHHFSQEVLWEIASQQHRAADPTCGSDLTTHRQDFEDLYAGMLKEVLAKLAHDELLFYQELGLPPRRTAFLIARNFARHGKKTMKFGPDGRFPLSGQDLACRLQRGIRNSYNDRKHLIERGAFEKVSECVPTHKAEYFVWKLG